MLEMIKALMSHNGIAAKEVSLKTNQPLMWYTSSDPKEARVKRAKRALVDRFKELKIIKSAEVKKEQFNEIFNNFNIFVEANNMSLSDVERRRVEIKAKVGDKQKQWSLSPTLHNNTPTP